MACGYEVFPISLEDGFGTRSSSNQTEKSSEVPRTFKAVHPAGSGISVCVESLDIDRKTESQTRGLGDLYKYRTTYVLYWQGIIIPAGWSRLLLAYNAKIDVITSHEIIEATGTTNQQVGKIAFGIGALLGNAAVDRMFDGK